MYRRFFLLYAIHCRCYKAINSCIFVHKFQSLLKSITIFFSLLLLSVASYSQLRFSAATDLGVQRSFKKEQQYWAIGHTVQAQFHFTPKEGPYLWISYYSNGRFTNQLTAVAKSPATSPQQINYTNSAKMHFKQFSVGWKKYLKGTCMAEDKWNLYGYAGFGLVFGWVNNEHSTGINTNDYDVPVRAGRANFKRLTLDGGLGAEFPIGADIYFYSEGRVWIPTTDYPSKYIFVNKDAPVAGMINFGIRVLF